MTHSSAFALLAHQAYQTLLAVFCLLWKFPVTILHSWILQFLLTSRCHWKALFLIHTLPSSFLTNSGSTIASNPLYDLSPSIYFLPFLFHSLPFLHFPLSRREASPSQALLSKVYVAVSCFTSTSILPFPCYVHCYVLTILVMNPRTSSNELGLYPLNL